MNPALRLQAINRNRNRHRDEKNHRRKHATLQQCSAAETFEDDEDIYNMIMDHRNSVRGRSFPPSGYSSNDNIQREENDRNGCLIATLFLLPMLLGILSYLT